MRLYLLLTILILSGCQYNAPDYLDMKSSPQQDVTVQHPEKNQLLSWNGVVASIDDDLKLHIESTAPNIPYNEVALAAIDIPIIGDKLLTSEVQEILEEILLTKNVRLEIDLKSVNGQEVPEAYIYLDDVRIQDLLIRSGIVLVDTTDELYAAHFADLQEEASVHLNGIWANITDNSKNTFTQKSLLEIKKAIQNSLNDSLN